MTPISVTRTRDGLELLRCLGRARPVPVAAAVVLRLVGAASPVLLAVVSGRLVAAVADGSASTAERPWQLLSLFAVITIAAWASGALQVPVSTAVARQIDGSLRGEVMALVHVPRSLELLQSGPPADDLDRLLRYNEGTGYSLGRGALAQLQNLIRGVAVAALAVELGRYNPLLAVLVVAAIWFGRTRLNAVMSKGWSSLDEHSADQRRSRYWFDLLASPQAAKEIRVFGLADWATENLSRSSRSATSGLFSWTRGMVRTEFANLPLLFAICVVGLSLPAWDAYQGSLSLGQFGTVLFVMASLLATVQIGFEQSYIGSAKSALQALDRFRRVVHAVPSVKGAPLAPSERPPLIRFEGVTFGYDGRVVLDHLDLEVRPGEVLALVGENGAGKSTLTHLLAGVYVPHEGRVTVEGEDLASTALPSWWDRLAIVPQDFLRLAVSAVDCVTMLDPRWNASSAALGDIAARAGAVSLIDRLPRGWDTMLSRGRHDGVDLSGGQWQKIALMRALAAVSGGARVLVLDEPTSQMDVRAELSFFDQVLRNLHDTSVVLISHRLSTVRGADRIAVLADGRIVESGSHDELMALGGRYSEMFRIQAGHYDLSNDDPTPFEQPQVGTEEHR